MSSDIEKTLVSVIVVAYQSDKFILDTLESIKLQTWSDIELIITDDASTDKTLQICNDWVEANKSRFIDTTILTVEENTGIPSNCDRGLSAAKGTWVKFIGADDILLENCIRDNMKTIISNPKVSLIISDLVEINATGQTLRVSPKNEGLNYFMKNQATKQKQLKAYARWSAFLNTPTFFYRRDLIKDIFNPDLDLKIHEDTFAIFKIINNGAKIYYLKRPTVKYRIHPKAISRDISLNDKREEEAYAIYKRYRREYLSAFNPIDLSVLFENWLRFRFKGINGHNGVTLFRKLSLFYWHLRAKGIEVKQL